MLSLSIIHSSNDKHEYQSVAVIFRVCSGCFMSVLKISLIILSSPPTPPSRTSPYDTSFEGDTTRTFRKNSSTSSFSPSQDQGYSFINGITLQSSIYHSIFTSHFIDDISQSKPISSISEDSDYMSSSVSSIEVGKDSFRRENSYGANSFVDPGILHTPQEQCSIFFFNFKNLLWQILVL